MALSKDKILDWLQDRWLDFRAQGVYFQAKFGMLAAYIAIVAVTLLLTPVVKAPCEIRWTKQNDGLSKMTVVEIVNRDLGTLNNFSVVISGQAVLFDGSKKSGKWQTRISYFAEGEDIEPLFIRPNMLKDGKGFPAPSLIDVQKVALLDEDGDVIVQTQPKYFQTQ
ncbi:MAG: hypothetical protein GY822_27650 [Deltaproteobacteria bacterium]|nr:hypothetical protein [Deltaproteobacteria bacterium]